jgi:cell shape-determining protein MreC
LSANSAAEIDKLNRHVEDITKEKEHLLKQLKYEVSTNLNKLQKLENENQTLRDEMLVISEQYRKEADLQAHEFEQKLAQVAQRQSKTLILKTDGETGVDLMKLNRELKTAIGELKSIIKLVKSNDPNASNISVMVDLGEADQDMDRNTTSSALRSVTILRKNLDVLRTMTTNQYVGEQEEADNEQCATQ